MDEEYFKKKKFDPALIDSYEDGFGHLLSKKPAKRLHRNAFQRTIAGFALSIRPRSMNEIMWLTGINAGPNALRVVRSLGGVMLYSVGRTPYWGAPHLSRIHVDPLCLKYDDWLLGKADWPAELEQDDEENPTNPTEGNHYDPAN